MTGRLGYAVDRSLLYVKGGAAWTRGKVDMFVNQNNVGVFTSTNNFATSGWTVGGGIEYALMPNWSAKLEYDYLNFGGQDRLQRLMLQEIRSALPRPPQFPNTSTT